jgi:hypothetical protein
VFSRNSTRLRVEETRILKLHIKIAASPKSMCKFVSTAVRLSHGYARSLANSTAFYKQSQFDSPEKHGFQDRCANIGMRIQTSDDYEWRTDLYDRTADRLDEGTRSGGIDGACEFTREMLDNLEEAVDHPDMTEELAEVLSTSRIKVEYRVETDISIS